MKAAIDAENEAIRAKNDALKKLKAKIGLKCVAFVSEVPAAQEPEVEEQGIQTTQEEVPVKARPDDPNDWGFWKEKCYVRVNQIRENLPPPAEEPIKDKKAA